VQDLVERGRQGGNGQSVRYIHQDNQGAYAARNAGLDLAQGKYIAFYDSDDIWLEHHLKDCIDAMEANPDVDCVFAPCQVVDHATGGTIQQNSFYVDGQPWDFLNLRTRRAGALKIIDDPVSTWCTIRHGLAIGPQNSVFHRRIFDRLRFPPYKPIEDQLLEIMVVKSGYRSAYLERIHVVYRVHNDNACCSSAQTSLDKRIEVMTSLADGLEWLRSQLVLTSRESRALRHRLSGIYFWNLGYSLLRHGRRREALPLLRRGLRLHCTNLSFWKTYLLALVGRTPA
jgi:glycosyltransferase involved in cell wall biosynthesis